MVIIGRHININADIIFRTNSHDRNRSISMKYIDLFLEALSAEKGRSSKPCLVMNLIFVWQTLQSQVA